jgi:hypothetical protein
LLTFTAVVCVQLAAYLSVFRGFQVSGKQASFFVGLFSPIACLVIVLIVKPLRARRHTRSALFRLPLETHWRMWVAFTFIPPAVVLVADSLIGGWSSSNLQQFVGLMSAQTFVIASTMFAVVAFPRGSIYLCETGIVLKGSYYFPWSRFRFVGWDPAMPGRITIHGSGFIRAVAIVPPEQRAAVDAVLKEKLGNDYPK